MQNTHKTQTTTTKYALITWYIIIVSKHNKFSCDGLRAYERYFDDEREDQKRFEKKGRDDKSKEREENMKTKCFLFPSFSDLSKNNRFGKKGKRGGKGSHLNSIYLFL